MGNMHLVTGFEGQEHITAIDQGAFNAALIGTGQFVLDKGKALEAQIISNNQIRILDGELMMHGRFVRLNPDTYVDLTIENGVQGKKRNDLIVARYTKHPVTGIESVDLVVIKGTSVDSNPVDPSHTEGDITNGAATQHDFPLWRIPLDGLNVGSPVALFGDPFMDSMRTLPEIRRQVNEIHGEVDKQLSEHDKQIDEKIAGIESYTKEETLRDSTRALFGKDAAAMPDDIFAHLGQYNEHFSKLPLFGQMETGSYNGTDTYGRSNPTQLTFGIQPKIVMVYTQSRYALANSMDWYKQYALFLVNGTSIPTYYKESEVSYRQATISYNMNGNELSWYMNSYDADYNSADFQLNKAGTKYYYIAIG